MTPLDAAMTAIANTMTQGYLCGLAFVVIVLLLRSGRG